MPATVTRVLCHGHDSLVDLVCDGAAAAPLVARVVGASTLIPGDAVWVSTEGAVHSWS